MIIFLVTTGHQNKMKGLKGTRSGAPVRIKTYDWLFRRRRVPVATYVFCDIERLAGWELRAAAEAYRQLAGNPGMRLLNDPRHTKSRFELLCTLRAAGVNDFAVYRADELPKVERFPVFIRGEQDHRGPLTDLIGDEAELDEAFRQLHTRGFPRRGLLIVEYAAEPIAENLYQKFSSYRVGDRVFAHHQVLDNKWAAKLGVQGLASDEQFQEELDFVHDNRFADDMWRIFDLAGIEFGRADYSLVRDRVQVYEINTNPELGLNDEHDDPRRAEVLRLGRQNILESVGALAPPSGPSGSVALTSPVFQQYRRLVHRLGRPVKRP